MNNKLNKGNSFSLEKLNINIENDMFISSDEYREFDMKKMSFLEDTNREKEYDQRILCKNNFHWGQLKLFISEFYVMTYILKDSDVKDILYIGAAPGGHLFPLSKIFKQFTFHLYDNGRFDKRLYSCENIKIHKKYFDDEEIKLWKSKYNKIFLISDIRNLSYIPETQTDEMQRINEKSVWNDMLLQQKWVEELEPHISLLKFRLPFPHKFVLEEGRMRKYLNGKIMKQVYNKPKSSETRLLVRGIEYREYDIVKYERQMFYHNTFVRDEMNFLSPIGAKKSSVCEILGISPSVCESLGLFNNYDDVYFTTLIKDFIRVFEKVESNRKNILKLIKFIINNLSKNKVDLYDKKLM